jgi:hypothetical protein
MVINDVMQFTKEMGVKPLIDARPEDLEAELCRVTDPTCPETASFYAASQVDGRPHYLQEPMMTIADMVEWHENRVHDIAEDTMLISKLSQCAKGKEGLSVATVKKALGTTRKRKAKAAM